MARNNVQAIDAPRFAPGQPARVDLPRQNVVRGYLLRVRGTYAVTGGSGAGTWLGLWRLLRQIQFRVGGRDVQSYTGMFLAQYLYLFSPEVRIQTEPSSLAAGTTDIELWAEIPMSMLHSVDPDEFGAPTALLPSPELVVTWGTVADLAKGMDGTPTLSNVDVQLYEVFHDRPSRAPQSFRPLLIATYEREVTASGPISIQLSELIAGDEIRAVFVEALSGGSGGTGYEYDDSLVTNVRLKASGRNVREQVPFALVQQDNVVDYRLDTGLQTGVAVLDAAPTGLTGPGQLWTVEGHVSPVLEVDAVKQAGDCKVRATVIYARGRVG